MDYTGLKKLDLAINRLTQLKEDSTTCKNIQEVNIIEHATLKGDCKNAYRDNVISIEIRYIENYKKVSKKE